MAVSANQRAARSSNPARDVGHRREDMPRAYLTNTNRLLHDSDLSLASQTEKEVRAVVQPDYPSTCRVRTGRLHRPAMASCTA